MTAEERALAVHPCKHGLGGYNGYCEDCIAAAIREAVAEEREACANLAEQFDRPHKVFDSRGGPRPPIQVDVADAIRARSEAES